MADTLQSLYLKYSNRVQRYLENDVYYQYLLGLIAAGKPTITQVNRILDKTVDERWLEAIEGAIPSIHEIIAHPRRFLKTVDEIVPVEKVRKINTATVQHLASHTQYISGMRGGNIQPGKLLTTETEESIDLYENRFVRTLIHKLSEFIEKRTSVLFWDTGNEQTSLLRMESAVEDDYEIIEYKTEMTIKNKQTYLENDSDKMGIFMRIDRVRRVVSDFRQSSFYTVMAGTATVRSPVQRTNQITKDPNYHKCYDLWQFLERYDEIGYEIDARETALDFDEDYLFQLYGNLAMNYTVFKSLLANDQRRLTEPPKRRKSIKPKFVRQIVEEFVDDYDVPDVEIRRVIVEEVTKAQLEIERRTKAHLAEIQTAAAKQTKVQLAKEKACEKLRLAKEKEKNLEKEKRAKAKALEQAALAKEKAKAREKAQLEKAKELEKAKAAQKKAQEKAKADKAKALEKAKAEQAKAREKAKAEQTKELEMAKAREKAQLEKAKELEKAKAAQKKAQEKAKADKAKALEKAKATKAKELEKAKATKEALRAKQKSAAKTPAKKPTAEKPAQKTPANGPSAEKPAKKPAAAKTKPMVDMIVAPSVAPLADAMVAPIVESLADAIAVLSVAPIIAPVVAPLADAVVEPIVEPMVEAVVAPRPAPEAVVGEIAKAVAAAMDAPAAPLSPLAWLTRRRNRKKKKP